MYRQCLVDSTGHCRDLLQKNIMNVAGAVARAVAVAVAGAGAVTGTVSGVRLGQLNEAIKGTSILFQILFLMEKSILYAKITLSQKNVSQNSVLNNYYVGLLFS